MVKVNHPILSNDDFKNDYYKYFSYRNLCERKFYDIKTDNSNYARVEHVYTGKEYRGNGYMANLIYDITNIILNNNLIPVLQTDINYKSSNKSYQNVGYKLEDVLVKANYERKIIKTL